MHGGGVRRFVFWRPLGCLLSSCRETAKKAINISKEKKKEQKKEKKNKTKINHVGFVSERGGKFMSFIIIFLTVPLGR
jgi:hypothetical protein